ncbi:protein containing CheW-like domain [Sulfurimonas gotlandica GD1]|uniref:Protein containing CheW-like domain n=1 Tax=Sulfurimonas gotlandica (strain DSM 19862 / JCM 16533 / GD1) TaxID=929558 RepID=B6BNV8_SULGG|nr:chemotaxis protein CheW [Sulfurimonas gotlandica]EDZ61255.1 CheW-like domain protein [Sulfurimonas gotlandica GD1]EHP28912.1 protein containing CheW-like domain [Sulfurimonas gotlandica GD1]
MQIQEILIIKNSQENYGISTEDINQISRVPLLMDLPLRPYGTRGLCGVGGNIVSIVDVNLLLDLPEVDLKAQNSRLLSLNGDLSSNALLVSEVYNTVDIEEANIEYIDNANDPIIAIYKYKDYLVQIISLETLISNISKVEIKSKEVHSGKVKLFDTKEENSTKFLIFAMSNERFALNIDYLREIILSDVNYTDIAGSSKDLLGLITLREELIAVIDLRSYYGFNSDKNEKNRILITSCGDETIGLLVDDIIDIKSFPDRDIEYMRDSFEDNKISGVIHDNNSLISFFNKEVLEEIFSKNSRYIDSKEKNKIKAEDSSLTALEVIVFKLADKEYAFNVEFVAEIIDIVDSTKVAYSDDSVDGVINIRGQIVTIVSLFKKLSIETKINEDSKIIVCEINDSKIGFIVDSISDIMDIKIDELRTHDDELFSNVLHLDGGKRLILSMDIQKIVSN